MYNGPNHKAINEPWEKVASDILRPFGARQFVSAVIQLSKALGEINRFHSKGLSEEEFKTLQKRMTEIRRIVAKLEKQRKIKGKAPLIPWQHLEYLFSGEERKDMKR